MFYGGLTYSAHPVVAGGGAGHDRRVRGGRPASTTRPGWARACASTTSGWRRSTRRVGAHRNLGLFGILDLVRTRDPWTPLTPFNGTSDEMKAIGKYLRDARPVHADRQQLDPHQPAAVHHRGRAGRGLRDHRRARSTSPTRRSPASRWRRPWPSAGASGSGPRRAAAVGPAVAPDRDVRPVRARRARRLGGRQVPRRRAVALPIALGPGVADRLRPAVPLGVRERPQPAALSRTSSTRSASRSSATRDGVARRVPVSGPRSTPGARRRIGFVVGAAARAGPGDRRSSTRGCSSGRSCRTSSPARPSRSSPSRR